MLSGFSEKAKSHPGFDVTLRFTLYGEVYVYCDISRSMYCETFNRCYDTVSIFSNNLGDTC